jgi:protein-tyrosine phosphatase
MASILVVCTGNVCRSPLAEGFLRGVLEARFGASAPTVSSAGTAGWEGAPAMPESVAAAEERGVDISGHRGRELVREHVDDADLIVGMAAEHRDAVMRSVPNAAGTTFTLKELVRLLDALPDADPSAPASEALVERVAEADRLRRSGFEGNRHDQDVVDPLGMPLDSYRAVAWELDEWSRRLADGLFGLTPANATARDEA